MVFITDHVNAQGVGNQICRQDSEGHYNKTKGIPIHTLLLRFAKVTYFMN